MLGLITIAFEGESAIRDAITEMLTATMRGGDDGPNEWG